MSSYIISTKPIILDASLNFSYYYFFINIKFRLAKICMHIPHMYVYSYGKFDSYRMIVICCHGGWLCRGFTFPYQMYISTYMQKDLQKIIIYVHDVDIENYLNDEVRSIIYIHIHIYIWVRHVIYILIFKKVWYIEIFDVFDVLVFSLYEIINKVEDSLLYYQWVKCTQMYAY